MDTLQKEQLDVNEQLKKLKAEIRRYRIPILKLSEEIGYPAALVSDIIFLRKKPDMRMLRKIEIALNNSIKDIVVSQNKSDQQVASYELKRLKYSTQYDKDKSEAVEELGEKVKTIRTRLQLSKFEFGARLSPALPPEMIQEIEANQIIPTLEHLIQIADLGKVTLDWLLRCGK
ncbi:helix-turn-helix domain-containing protein [Lactococcus allomyrinae]|uniref:XRE family transcriptional regulator n=1 Tax=Lactococcus allomyrinae TaxID=2419773 RepID=A0A387BR16_9LACT|nr:helix-turn-helix transcriptional regulator [Lactococcus allomyrinae]AYG00911.1 XRE family transcriptional regulator [Lactococcus allomyrinae]